MTEMKLHMVNHQTEIRGQFYPEGLTCAVFPLCQTGLVRIQLVFRVKLTQILVTAPKYFVLALSVKGCNKKSHRGERWPNFRKNEIKDINF